MLKKGKQVEIICGKDKGKKGEVIEIIKKSNKVKVKGINFIKKHEKTTKEKKGGIISKENFILISNLKIFPENMKKNLDLLNGLVFSQALLLLMIDKKGMERQKAYNIVQKNAMDVWNSKKNFLETIKKDRNVRGIMNDSELS